MAHSSEPLPSANWSYPTSIRFGVGRIGELSDACAALDISNPLLVTDRGLAGSSMIRNAMSAFADSGGRIGVFSEVGSNPTGGDVERGVEAFREGRHDGVIAFGGGSALDAGKAVAFMSGQNRPIWDFEDVGDNWRRAEAHGISPVVAVPTTAGTGSETGRASVITDEATQTKKVIFHPAMMPAIVIADPALTVGLPANLTAATGMDALAHCLEAFCAPGYHPMADGIAVEGLRLIRNWLPRAVENGADLTARGHMLVAAGMGSTAFQKGLGAIHALSHPVGAMLGAHHGLTNAVFMPYVMAFNRPAIEEKMRRLANYLGCADPSFDAVFGWILELRQRFGIPETASDLGVMAEHIDQLAQMAAADPTAAGNPIPVGATELKGLYEASLVGRLQTSA